LWTIARCSVYKNELGQDSIPQNFIKEKGMAKKFLVVLLALCVVFAMAMVSCDTGNKPKGGGGGGGGEEMALLNSRLFTLLVNF